VPAAAAAAAEGEEEARRAAVADAPKLRDDAAAVSRAFGALAATALGRLRASCSVAHVASGGLASASDGCAVAVNRVRLTMRMVAATCGSATWARVIGLDGSCATTTGAVVCALAGLFSAEVRAARR
jgi:hypothetical protein